MEPGELKPLLGALLLPPAGPLLLALAGLLLATAWRGWGLSIAAVGVLAAFVFSTNAMALLLSRHLLPPSQAVSADDLRGRQAIVVLGGGVLPQAAEYGAAQPNANTLARLRYGARLARQTGMPLAFAGGVGWASTGMATETEAAVARRVLLEDYGLKLQWADAQSRDTRENARYLARLLLPQRVRRIVLVTDAWHMPRAAAAFRSAGFEVLPAPTGLPGPVTRPLLEWLPSSLGATRCREVLREWVALQVR